MHRRWQVLSNLGIPHDPPSVLGIGNMTSVLKDGERVTTFEKTLCVFYCSSAQFQIVKLTIVFSQFFVRDLENKKKFGNVHGCVLAGIDCSAVCML